MMSVGKKSKKSNMVNWPSEVLGHFYTLFIQENNQTTFYSYASIHHHENTSGCYHFHLAGLDR
jgi:hypothetical protein